MSTVIDSTRSGGSMSGSREKFHKRYRQHIRRAVERTVQDGSIKDLGQGGIDITVPSDGLEEPDFRQGQGGVRHGVLPGNKEYAQGDSLPKPAGGGKGKGGKASKDGNGQDDFTFHLSEEEFLRVFFEDLELPNLVNRGGTDTTVTQLKRAGFTTDGSPDKLDLVRSRRARLARHTAAAGGSRKEQLRLLDSQLSILEPYNENSNGESSSDQQSSKRKTGPQPLATILHDRAAQVKKLRTAFHDALSSSDRLALMELDNQLREQQEKIERIPGWNQSTDLRYRQFNRQPKPVAKAAMICVMDVSGSMDEEKKYQAKAFYFLLYRFLREKYGKGNVDVKFIAHTQFAKEVDEQEFFYGTETGGTVVSSGLSMARDMMNERYGNAGEWNIYMAQASDGDNWGGDDPLCAEILGDHILPRVQGFFYTEISKDPPQSLWRTYESLRTEHSENFWIARIGRRPDIFKVFRDFFAKRDVRTVATWANPRLTGE